MFRSASLFIGTSFTVAVFTIFATSNVDSIVGIPHTQGMQQTWWPEAGTCTIIVTGPYLTKWQKFLQFSVSVNKSYCFTKASKSSCVTNRSIFCPNQVNIKVWWCSYHNQTIIFVRGVLIACIQSILKHHTKFWKKKFFITFWHVND